jgi:hypothetical protein
MNASQTAIVTTATAIIIELLNTPGAGAIIGVCIVLAWMGWIQPHICDRCKSK